MNDEEDAFDHMPAWAGQELKWADTLLDAMVECAFAPDLTGFEEMFASSPPMERREEYLLRLRRHGDGYRIHGHADVVWNGASWSPNWGSNMGFIYPSLRDAVDDGLPAAMASHTKVVHAMLALKLKVRQDLANKIGGKGD
jgi:hypothetical protein